MTRSSARVLVATASAVVLVLGLAGAADASPSARTTTTIVRAVGSYYSSPHWSPSRVKISPHDTVEWLAVTNHHHLVAYGGHWTFNQVLPAGASVTHRFAQKGTYLFRCSIHSTIVNGVCQGMCGKVIVH